MRVIPVATHFAKISIVREEPGRYGFPGGAWEPDSAGIKRVCGVKGTIHCVKKFPPDPLQETLYSAGIPASCARKPGCRRRIEVFGEGLGEGPFYKKVLPVLLP